MPAHKQYWKMFNFVLEKYWNFTPRRVWEPCLKYDESHFLKNEVLMEHLTYEFLRDYLPNVVLYFCTKVHDFWDQKQCPNNYV